MDTTVARCDDWCGELDRLVTELSSVMIRIAPEDVTGSIENALRRVGEELSVDRTTLVELAGNGDSIETAFHWVRPSLAPVDLEADLDPLKTMIQSLRVEGEPLILAPAADDLPVEAAADGGDDLQPVPTKWAVAIPVTIAGQFTCALGIGVLGDTRTWPERLVERLRLLTEILTTAWYRRGQELALRQSRAEIVRLTGRLDGDTRHAPKAEATVAGFEEIVGDSPTLRAALARLQEVASSDSTVLLLGETGTGKELFAKALHARSPRRQYPLVSVNCAALPPTLIESELFGHERGAFTGAVTQRQGRFELAHRGTLFLDEIGDLPLDLQAKLLRVLQEGEFERLGTSHTRKVDVRIVAATHRDLEEAVADGGFRDDLYYRLNVFPIRLPPLRERRNDIPALVWFLINKRQRGMRRWIKRVPQEVMEVLQRHSWPGNIRELENVIERALIHSTGDTLVLLDDDIEQASDTTAAEATTLNSVERAHIEEILRECGWRINGTGNAAERLGLHPNTLRFRMKKLGIVRARPAVAAARQPLTRLR